MDEVFMKGFELFSDVLSRRNRMFGELLEVDRETRIIAIISK